MPNIREGHVARVGLDQPRPNGPIVVGPVLPERRPAGGPTASSERLTRRFRPDQTVAIDREPRLRSRRIDGGSSRAWSPRLLPASPDGDPWRDIADR